MPGKRFYSFPKDEELRDIDGLLLSVENELLVAK